MRLCGVRVTVRRWMAAVAIVAGSLALGLGSDVRHRSCHLCHNRDRIDSTTVWLVPIIWRRAVTTGFPAPAGHRHSWRQYSRSRIGPLTGRSAAGRATVYTDGSTAPDGLR